MITPDKGVVIAQRYTLVRRLAAGGMGSVWIARHRDLELDVTIKFMAPSLIASVEARTRFEREARVAARLDSQHVVHVHDYGVEDGSPYMVMELLKGESLWTRLARDGTLPVDAAGRLLLQICKALRTAHDAGLVHRDLKPDNVFLARKDEDEVVKILDFGIAKTTDLGDAQATTETGVIMGSVHYMSPEQIRSSRAVDHRGDLWSIGVILYRMLVGRLPFPGEKLGDVLVRVCTDTFVPVSKLAPGLPPGIDAFFARALAKDPDMRFQSAMEMAEGFTSMTLEATAPPASPAVQPAPPVAAQVAPGALPVPTPFPVAPAFNAGLTVPMPSLPSAPTPLRPGFSPTIPIGGAHVPVPATAPRAAPAAPPAPAASQAVPFSLDASPAVAARPGSESRATLLVAVAVVLAIATGAVAIVLLRAPQGDTPAPAAAASETAATASPAASAVPQTAPPPSSTAAAAPAGDTAKPLATAAPEAPEPVAATAAPASHPTGQPARAGASRPGARAGCNPPYTVDARGVRVPKMECL